MLIILYWIVYAGIAGATIRLGANMWRWGGDGQSLWRNPGVPILLAVVKLGLLGLGCLALGRAWNWWYLAVLLYIPALWGCIQAFSYGLSSPIHRIWEWIWNSGGSGNDVRVEFCTRATCGFLWSMPAIIFAFFTGHWVLLGIYSVFLTIANGIFGALVKDVEISERAVGASVATSIFV
jgi:hypothetical protein